MTTCQYSDNSDCCDYDLLLPVAARQEIHIKIDGLPGCRPLDFECSFHAP